MQRCAADKAGEDDIWRTGGLLLQALAIFIGVVGIANQYQRYRTPGGGIGGNEIVQPFLFDKTGDGNNILARF